LNVPRKLTVGSCFSGIGGLELGLEWTGGFETKWQIEIDPYASAVLKKHWPGVQRFSDITTVSRPPRVDVICGGFPCQDVSLAGARAGLDGKRSPLWTEMFRLVREVKPRWVVAENVPGLLSSDRGRFAGGIFRDLAVSGYDFGWFRLPANSVGAPHKRERIFIVANRRGERLQGECEVRTEGRPAGRVCGESSRLDSLSVLRGLFVRDPLAFPRLRLRLPCSRRGKLRSLNYGPLFGSDTWPAYTGAIRVAHGVPSRVDRLKCLGNAVVPAVAQRVGEMILEYERGAA
jgi:DNA (cytosine-5)-methyltransferase 1